MVLARLISFEMERCSLGAIALDAKPQSRGLVGAIDTLLAPSKVSPGGISAGESLV